MNCHIEFIEFDVKHEENSLSTTDLKRDSQDALSEKQMNAEECDVKHETYVDPHDVALNYAISKDIEGEIKKEIVECVNFPEHVDIKHEIEPISHHFAYIKEEETEASENDLVQDYEDKLLEEQRNAEDNESNVAVVFDISKSYFTNFQEEKCDIHVSSNDTGTNVNTHTLCKKLFSHSPNNTIHTNISDKYFKCNTCKKLFPNKHKFTQHKYLHGEKRFVCNICNKSFSLKFSLIQHLRIHTDEKTFTCNICNKSFRDKSGLKRHTRIHTNEKPFSCSLCNKSYNVKFHLTQHLRTHTNEKPFTCNLCNKSFSMRCTLIKHIRTHTHEKPFSCNFCGKPFSDQSNLVRHVRTHTKERPFSCDICNRSFYQKVHLSDHTRTHTNIQPF